MGVKEIWTQRATICSGKLEPVTEPKGASVAWYKRIKTGGVKGNLIQSCCSGICCFETTSQCMQAACQDPILHCHEYSPGLVNQKKWRNPKSNAGSFGSDEFDQGSVQSFLSTQRWERIFTHRLSISMVACWTDPFAQINVSFFRKVMTTPTHPPLELGRRISGKTKDDNLGGNSSSWGQPMKTPTSLLAFFCSIKLSISGAG